MPSGPLSLWQCFLFSAPKRNSDYSQEKTLFVLQKNQQNNTNFPIIGTENGEGQLKNPLTNARTWIQNR